MQVSCKSKRQTYNQNSQKIRFYAKNDIVQLIVNERQRKQEIPTTLGFVLVSSPRGDWVSLIPQKQSPRIET